MKKREKKRKLERGQWKTSKFKWITPPSTKLSSSAASLHLTPQCSRIKMTTHFQKHTHKTHTHTPGPSLGSVRGRYRPYFITDFTHVSNHKIRVSHFSGQTQTFPFHPSRVSVHPSDQSQAQSTGCSASSHTPFANCQDPILPPKTHTHAKLHTNTCTHSHNSLHIK